MSKWTTNQTSRKPEQFEKLNTRGDWMITRNVREITDEEGNKFYKFESKIVSNEEKEAYEDSLYSVEKPIAKTEKSLDSNDTTIMEALADIYTAIEQLREEFING